MSAKAKSYRAEPFVVKLGLGDKVIHQRGCCSEARSP